MATPSRSRRASCPIRHSFFSTLSGDVLAEGVSAHALEADAMLSALANVRSELPFSRKSCALPS